MSEQTNLVRWLLAVSAAACELPAAREALPRLAPFVGSSNCAGAPLPSLLFAPVGSLSVKYREGKEGRST